MATFDKDEFRRKAEAKAKAQLAKKRESAPVVGIGPNPAENSYIESPLTSEELKVVESYRKWKEARKLKEEDDGATAPAANPAGGEAAGGEAMAETKAQRVERLKRKIERRKRIEGLKAQLAEKRRAESPDAIREQAMELKQRIQKVSTSIKALKEGAMPDPVSPPAGAATEPTGAAIPGADGMPGAIPNLPPEITAEIQNIATAAQSLAQMAGVAPAAPQPGADMNAGIPPETGDATGAGMLPEAAARRARIERIKVLLEKKKAEKKNDKKDDKEEKDDGKKKFPFDKKKEEVENTEEDDKMIEETRARAAARREALKQIRAKAMQEKSYDAEEKGGADAQAYVKNAMDSGGAMGDKGYEFIHDNAIQKAGVKHDGPSPSMPGKSESAAGISAAKVWPAKDLNYGGKVPEKMPSTPDVNPVRKSGGQPRMPGTGDKGAVVKESTDWAERQVDHFIERKELDFKKLLSEGKLG